ncbi:hypothetical protein I308_106689 [Cryptococcus tetragattii IND107]|uniref:Uncharacterized protein n=1 Tax=Cryptococcus tetragattii IND107 TaxID=1296105 RepID=A0ABR3BIZ8_9TREE
MMKSKDIFSTPLHIMRSLRILNSVNRPRLFKYDWTPSVLSYHPVPLNNNPALVFLLTQFRSSRFVRGLDPNILPEISTFPSEAKVFSSFISWVEA